MLAFKAARWFYGRMSHSPDAQGEVPRRPRLVLPGATDGPARPKIVLPGVGLVDPNATAAPAEEVLPVEQDVVYAEPTETGASESAEFAAAEPEVAIDQETDPVAAETSAESADDFLSSPAETEGGPVAGSGRPPELRAAPAELKEMAPRRLGPPPGWEAGEEVPPMEVESAPPETAWEQPGESAQEVPQPEAYYEGPYAEQPEQAYEPQYDEQSEQAYEPQYEETFEEQAAPVPVGIPLRPRVPTPLTSPHSDRPATRRVTQQVRPPTGQTTRLQTGLPAPHGHTTQAIPTKHGPHPVATQRLLPSWVLVSIGFLVGAIAALVAVVKSPLRDKIGLVERTQANAYVLAVLKEERKQVQTMLDEFHRNARIVLSEDMAEFRTEMGRKAPEKMTMQELAAEIKEQEALKKEEEEEDKKAAEEEAKAAEEDKKEAEAEKKE